MIRVTLDMTIKAMVIHDYSAENNGKKPKKESNSQ